MTGGFSVLVRNATALTKAPKIDGWVCRWVNTDYNRHTKEFIYRPEAGRDNGTRGRIVLDGKDGN